MPQTTQHQFYYQSATSFPQVADESVALVVTSPPYPMIEMWDEAFTQMDPKVGTALKAEDGTRAFALMHAAMRPVWEECYRVLMPGGILCLNIGDATRTLKQQFRLFPNHAQLIQDCLAIGFTNLPNILWRKATNAPNKFMGSGMYAPGAYVTLEHEFILVFRKGNKRLFKKESDKIQRRTSAYFWEERNRWFSDLWELRGVRQLLPDAAGRARSAAYPLEIPYRLILMFSLLGDTVLDPFMGTGTTAAAALATGRHSIGIEWEKSLQRLQRETLQESVALGKSLLRRRIENHLQFVQQRQADKGEGAFKYLHPTYGFSIMTRQEQQMDFYIPETLSLQGEHSAQATYTPYRIS